MSVNLMQSVEVLEKLFYEAIRNLSQDAVASIKASPDIPQEYRESSVFKHANAIYWQIQAFKKVPGVIMYHPV